MRTTNGHLARNRRSSGAVAVMTDTEVTAWHGDITLASPQGRTAVRPYLNHQPTSFTSRARCFSSFCCPSSRTFTSSFFAS
jgi:hypothetical protein